MADEAEGYFARQQILPEFSDESMKKLAENRILVVGAGGVGSAVLLYLSGVGIGHITIVDADTVSSSNIHRQVLYSLEDLGKNKATLAAASVQRRAPRTSAVGLVQRITAENAPAAVRGFDLVLDCSDNPETRVVLGAACAIAPAPRPALVSAAAEGWSVQVITCPGTEGAPCFRCIARTLRRAAAAPIGVFGPAPGASGCVAAAKAVRYLLGLEREPAVVLGDLREMRFRNVKTFREQRAGCPCTFAEDRSMETMLAGAIL